jgi:putative cell wall-binding protein
MLGCKTRTFRRMSFVALLVLAMLVGAVAPALARTPVIRASAYRPAGAPLTQAASGPEEFLMPMGSRVKNALTSADFVDFWDVPLHGQAHLTVKLTAAAGKHFALDLWQEGIDDAPILSTGHGSVETLDYTTTGAYWHTIAVYGDVGAYTLEYSFTDPPAEASTSRIAGADRFKTAVALSQAAYASGTATTVVLATGTNFADALAASGLAGSYGGPLLLTRPTSLPAEVATEIDRLDGSADALVLVVGSANAVSDGVVTTLEGLGKTVERVQGPDRYATAVAIARKIKQHETDMGRTFAGAAFVAKGRDFPDALAVSPYAFSQHMPILLTETNSLPATTAAAFAGLGIDTAYVAGGESVVSPTVYNQLPAATKDRIQGSNRYLTALVAADYAVTKGWADWNYAGIATGVDFPDALGGGVLCGKNHGVLLLSQPYWNTADVYNAVTAHHPSITNGLHLFGGTSVLSSCAFGDYDWAMTGGAPGDCTW